MGTLYSLRPLPRKRTRKSHRKLHVSLILLALVLLAAWNYFRPLPDPTATAVSLTVPAQNVSLAWPNRGAAALEAQYLSEVLDNGNNAALPTASLAKLITCLTVLQSNPLEIGDLGPPMTLTARDVDLYLSYQAKGGSVVRVSHGEQLREYQAFQALLLPSANNIADSFALWAFNSMDDYRKAATAYVQNLGLTGTVIGSDASGMAPDTVSTPRDMIVIGEQTLASPVLTQIVGQKDAVLPIEGAVHNVNKILGVDGIIGLKTGNTDQNKGAFLFAARYDVAPGQTATLIGVVMGMNSLNDAFAASRTLLASAKLNLSYGTPVAAGKTVATYKTAWGASVPAVAKQNISTMLWKGTTLKPDVQLQTKNLDYGKGATVGRVIIKNGKSNVGSDIVLGTAIPEPSVWWRLFRH